MANPRANTMLQAGTVTFLFTDIEGSTQLWEQDPERMSAALAGHDALARAAVEGHRRDGGKDDWRWDMRRLRRSSRCSQRHACPATGLGRSGEHERCSLASALWVTRGHRLEHRDSDFLGPPVNRAARIMGAAHGGQVLLSQAVVDCVLMVLPPAVSLRDLARFGSGT